MGDIMHSDAFLTCFSEAESKVIYTVMASGKIVLGDGASLDDASLAFWNHVKLNAPEGWKVEFPK